MTRGKISIVVAVCNNGGIGIKGQLPWRLKGDMAFFKRITSKTQVPEKKNAVIMGRKTWDSIPSKFRPLANRVNIVISRTLDSLPDGALVARDFPAALQLVDSRSDVIEQTFVIGGSSIYKMALGSGLCKRVYLTRVLHEFECDTIMPPLDDNSYRMVDDSNVPSDTQTENGIPYKFEVYEKIPNNCVYLNVMVAFVDKNRGFGYKNRLPWPYIKADHDHYIGITSRRTHSGARNAYVKGRETWHGTSVAQRQNPCVINVIVSSRLSVESRDEHLHHVVRTLDGAMDTIRSLGDAIEHVWVMGGTGIFQEALSQPQCTRVYVTRMYKEFPADRFFPPFEHLFEISSDVDVQPGVQEDSGIQFEFQVYERKHLQI